MRTGSASGRRRRSKGAGTCLIPACSATDLRIAFRLIALINPNESWVARYQEIDHLVRGCYAITVTGSAPVDDEDEYED